MIRVLVVEEVRAICEIIATVLRSEADLEVVGRATGLDEAVAHLAGCDVAVVNACMATDASIRLVRGLRRLAPQVKIVVMGLACSQQAVRQCLEAGVSGYVLKDRPAAELIRTIRDADRNEALAAPTLAGKFRAYVAEPTTATVDGELDLCGPQNLTRREREVLGLVQQGLTNQEIATVLVIELGTVKNHIHNILRKLNVNSRHDAVRVSRQAGVWALQEQLFLGSPRPLELQPERASFFSPALVATN